MNETSKAEKRRAALPLFQRAFSGYGIDIGGGADPLKVCPEFPEIRSVANFDKTLGHGDAAMIHELRPRASYDFVYSSQTLEDMEDPELVLRHWGALVKPGGYLVFTVPDFDLYEGGVWPSRRNGAHKTCWGVGRNLSAPREAYVNVLSLIDVMAAPTCDGYWQLLLLQMVDTNYDYAIGASQDQTLGAAEAFIEVVMKKRCRRE